MTAQFVTDALVMAIWRRGKPNALLHHSDRGSQGGFKRSSQRDPSRLIEVAGQAILRAFSNQAFCGAVS
jgi:transposase InsO family protein